MVKDILELIEKEKKRQDENIELIASENFVSEDVLKAVGSILTNKYSEGYPANRTSGNVGRYYGGCQVVDEIEEKCCDLWRKVFNTDYHVNVQPHCGSTANFAAYFSVLNYGDTILSMSLDNGAHLTHGSPVSFSGKFFNMVFYDVDDNGFIDMEDVKRKAEEHKPKLILAGASAYSRIIHFDKFKEIADSIGAYFMVDMAHIAGLIAAGVHPTPFGYADIITTTTHKTLRGPRGGMIFCKKELAKKVDSAIFPFSQGGPLQHIIAGKAVAAEECLTEDYKKYIEQVVKNCKAMCNEFIKMGYKGHVCFKVGAVGCSHGMWAYTDESTDGYSPDSDLLFHSFRCDENYWDAKRGDEWCSHSIPKQWDKVSLSDVKTFLKSA